MKLQLVCCFPGLPGLWVRGLPRAVLVAVVFSWIVCLLLLATFVWPQWINAWVVRFAWLGIVTVWISSVIRNHWTLGRMMGRPDDQAAAAFLQAQREYLQGNWFEAEAILLDLMQQFPRDAEAILLLVSVLKRTGRWKPALRRLDQLETLDTAAPWRFEILRERKLIETRLASL